MLGRGIKDVDRLGKLYQSKLKSKGVLLSKECPPFYSSCTASLLQELKGTKAPPASPLAAPPSSHPPPSPAPPAPPTPARHTGSLPGQKLPRHSDPYFVQQRRRYRVYYGGVCSAQLQHGREFVVAINIKIFVYIRSYNRSVISLRLAFRIVYRLNLCRY